MKGPLHDVTPSPWPYYWPCLNREIWPEEDLIGVVVGDPGAFRSLCTMFIWRAPVTLAHALVEMDVLR